MGSLLLNTNLSSLYTCFNPLFPSPNRPLIPSNSISFPFHFKSLQGCNICWVQRRPIIATAAHKICRSVDLDDFSVACETGDTVEEEPLTCPLGWWEGHDNEDIFQIFEDWCKYGKVYMSDKEKLRRFKVFKYSYEDCRQHDEFSNTDGEFFIHEYSDRTGFDFAYIDETDDMVEEEKVILCDTVEAWNEQLAKGQRNNKLTVAEFSGQWCQPCGLMIPIIDELAEKMPEVTFLAVDVTGSELKVVAEKLGVDAIPTALLMRNGEVVDKFVGPLRDEVHLKVLHHRNLSNGLYSGFFGCPSGSLGACSILLSKLLSRKAPITNF